MIHKTGDIRWIEYNEIYWVSRSDYRIFGLLIQGCYLFSIGSSDEPARFLEIHYRGTTEDQAPHALVGKGKLIIDQLQL